MTPFTRSVRVIMIREFHRIAERRTLYLLAIGLPLILFPLLASIYTRGLLREMPVAVYDADHSELSRLLVRAIEADPAFRIVESGNSVDEIRDAFQRGEINGGFVIPPNLERDIKHGRTSTIVVFNDASNLIVANTTLKEASTIVRTVSAGIVLRKLRSAGLGEEQAMHIVNAVRIQTQTLYNPNYNYLNYLGLGIIPVMFQMLIMVASVLVISSEFTHGTFRELATLANGSPVAILLGKFLPHFLVHSGTALGVYGILYPVAGVHPAGSMGPVLVVVLEFVAASLCFGIAISSLFHEQMFATELALFLNMPAFIFSGFIFPFQAMPWIHTAFGHALPFTYFLYAFLKLFQMGAPVSTALPDMARLGLFILIPGIVALLELRHHVVVDECLQAEERSARP